MKQKQIEDSCPESSYNTRQLVDNFYKKLEDTIGEPPSGIDFTFGTYTILINEDTPKERVEKVLVPSFKYAKGTPIILAYVQSLMKLFPEWHRY